MRRRTFIRTTAVAAAGISMTNPTFALISSGGFESKRPPLKKRTFVSDSVEAFVSQVKMGIPNAELGWLFENCFTNTLDTTIRYSEVNGKPDTFIITGDIPAMWLRDSTCQVWPYLQLMNDDPKLKSLIQGVINRQVNSVLLDPYANAFLFDKNEKSQWLGDHTNMKPGVHERKFEVDSLCYVIRLSHAYWKSTNDISLFDENWKKAIQRIIAVFRKQQKKKGNNPEYTFSRNSEIPTETLANSGNGRFVNPVGLICSPFRPSDDATIFQFLIPSNFFALQSLRNLSRIYHKHFPTDPLSAEIDDLASDLFSAIIQYGIANHPVYGKIYAYEVDGFGSLVLQDEPNVPSLLSLSYLGCVPNNDQVYQNTRKFIFSNSNPYYLKSTAADGIGSPHTPPNYIWHLGIMMRALTSENNDEIANCIKMLKATHGGTGFMHEGFDKDKPANFTRPWFSWANSMFGELIVKTWKASPQLLS
jgi:meiotically up-regulated gene 157 (Mug157) protein